MNVKMGYCNNSGICIYNHEEARDQGKIQLSWSKTIVLVFNMSYPKQNSPEAKPMLKRISRNLRYRILFVYRRIFSLVWLANIAVLIAFFLVPIDRTWLTTIALVNLTIS